MDEAFLSEADCVPNLNSATIAGKIMTCEALKGKTVGMSFLVGYTKTWPNGGTQDIPVRCYVTGTRVEQVKSWLKPGEVVLVHGEITDKNAVYAHVVERLSIPQREPGEGDAYLAGVQQAQRRHG
jgi:hypothetical protein